MSILNYFFIGFMFVFVMDLWANKLKNMNLLSKTINWNLTEKLLAIIIWPIAALWFFIAFIRTIFKK